MPICPPDKVSAIAFRRVGWANHESLAISSKCHAHLPTRQGEL
ncbi:hypothetical protein [Moorena sp. SIO4E2]|nr:hypothetical protein [Moorena sp. SIO4E2]